MDAFQLGDSLAFEIQRAAEERNLAGSPAGSACGIASGTSAARGPFTHMIAITITAEAYEAVRASPFGQAMVAPPPGPDGLIRIWLDREFVDRLGRMREPGESYSDVILRMATP